MTQSLFDLPEFGLPPGAQREQERLSAPELRLARLALALGAPNAGGPLSSNELGIVAAAAEFPDPDVAEVLAARNAIGAGADPLGLTLCRLRPAAARRNSGAFYTQPQLVEPMVEWALRQRPERIVDAGCGSGRFAAAAVRRRRDVSILAVDVDPLAALLTRAALAVLQAHNARVVQGDYTTMDIPRIHSRTAYLGNPPYVRHHDVPSETKAWALRAARGLGKSVSGLAGMHALFFLATALHAAPGDVGCFVTSAEWLDVNYGSLIRDLLTDGLGGRSLDVLRAEAVPFEDAMATAAITTFEVGSDLLGIRMRLAHSLEDITDLGSGPVIGSAVLRKSERWSGFLRGRPTGERSQGLVALGSVARVHRGVVTGANDLFVLTREEACKHGVERWCRPAVTSAREILESGGVLRDGPERRLLLDLPRDFDRASDSAVDAYLAAAERPGTGGAIAGRYIPSHRRPWWHLGRVPRPPVVATYMARQPPFFALNPDGLALINIGHGVYPKAWLSPEKLAAVVHGLNEARPSFTGNGRTYQGGLEKFEPREMESLLVPAQLFGGP
jgi:adenine-specific DNA-methyltransferase